MIFREHKLKSVFESPADLIAENHFPLVSVIDLRGLTMMATTDMFVDKVNVNLSNIITRNSYQ